MPYAEHLRLTCSGVFKLSSGSIWETFAYRVNLSSPPGLAIPFSLQRATDYAADAVAFHGSAGPNISAVARLTEVKLAKIGPLGKYLLDPFIIAVDQPGGNPGGLSQAPQVAWAMSMGSARRGPTGKGRFYIPLPNVTPNSADGKVDAVAANNANNALKIFLDNLNNTPGVDGQAPKVVIASRKGYNSDVTTCRVGRVLDTVRSRRQAVGESYVGPLTVV